MISSNRSPGFRGTIGNLLPDERATFLGELRANLSPGFPGPSPLTVHRSDRLVSGYALTAVYPVDELICRPIS